jgi:hypothetical protein
MAMGVLSWLPSLMVILIIPTVSASDEAVLLDLKAHVAAGGSGGSGTLASWNGSANFCSWEGVTCSSRRPQRVTYGTQLVQNWTLRSTLPSCWESDFPADAQPQCQWAVR